MVMAIFSLGTATPILAHRLWLAVGRIFYARRQLAELHDVGAISLWAENHDPVFAGSYRHFFLPILPLCP
jgi:hypothetical protein